MRLGAWLQENSISQADFGVRIGASVATVNRICAGSQNIPMSITDAILRETGGAVTADDLHEGWRDFQASQSGEAGAAA